MVAFVLAMVARHTETSTMNDKKPKKFITYSELAELTNLPLGTLYHRVAEKKIPHVRLGRRLVRFDAEEIARWLKAQEVAPAK